MSATQRPLALVTGASAGLGVVLARRFAERGHDLVLVARRADRLEALATELRADHGVAAHVRPMDLAAPGAAEALITELHASKQRPDVVVNNAGFGAHGPLHELPAEGLARMLHLNVLALAQLTRGLLPDMLAQRGGGVLNVASTAAFQPGPYMTHYFATKAFVLAFSEGLTTELRGTGVRCCCLCPGPTATEFGAAAGMEDAGVPTGPMMSAERCVDLGLRGWDRGDAIVITGLANRFGTVLSQVLPRPLVRSIVARILRPRSPR